MQTTSHQLQLLPTSRYRLHTCMCSRRQSAQPPPPPHQSHAISLSCQDRQGRLLQPTSMSRFLGFVIAATCQIAHAAGSCMSADSTGLRRATMRPLREPPERPDCCRRCLSEARSQSPAAPSAIRAVCNCLFSASFCSQQAASTLVADILCSDNTTIRSRCNWLQAAEPLKEVSLLTM